MLEVETEVKRQKLAEEVMKSAQKINGYEDESYLVTIVDFSLDQWKRKAYPNDIIGRKDIRFKKTGYEM